MECGEKSAGERKPNIQNLLDLRRFLEEKLGGYFGLFSTTLRTISGIKDPRELPGDKEERKRVIEEALIATPSTPENLESINNAMRGVVRLNKSEVERFKQKPGREGYVKDCQKVVDTLEGRELILDEGGNVALTELNSGKRS